MEIERKYLVKQLPEKLSTYPHRLIEQGYLSTEPVIRIRKDGDKYELTYKSKGLMIREEYNSSSYPIFLRTFKTKNGRLSDYKRKI